MTARRPRLATVSSLMLVGSIALAVTMANLGTDVDAPWRHEWTVSACGMAAHLTTHNIVVNGLMTAFFLMVGLEIRYEIAHGSMRSPKAALAPILCALGGMLAPALIFMSVVGEDAARAGWAIPTATDVALSAGLLALAAPAVSSGARSFLLTLAVADDIGGVVIIAVWYSGHVTFLPLLVGALVLISTSWAVRRGWLSVGVSLVVLIPLWMLVVAANVPPAIIGAIFGMAVPLGSHEGGQRVRHQVVHTLSILRPVVGLIVLPAFALVSAGVRLDFSDLNLRIVLATYVGLCIGKPLGILSTLWLLLRARIIALPAATRAPEMVGVGMVAGIGMTVSIFLAEASFAVGQWRDSAIVGVLFGSLSAALMASLYFRLGRNAHAS